MTPLISVFVLAIINTADVPICFDLYVPPPTFTYMSDSGPWMNEEYKKQYVQIHHGVEGVKVIESNKITKSD